MVLFYIQKCDKKILPVSIQLLYTPRFDYSVLMLQGSWILLPLYSLKHSMYLKHESQKGTETLKQWLGGLCKCRALPERETTLGFNITPSGC